MRGLAVSLILLSCAGAFANPPSQKITGYVTGPRGNGMEKSIVGEKATTSANPTAALADADVYATADAAGYYSLSALSSRTHNLAAVQVLTNGSGVVTSISLPKPLRAAVVASGQDDAQPLSVGSLAPILNATQDAVDSVGPAPAVRDNDFSTAWVTDPAKSLDQQYVVLDLGAATYLAEAVVVWQGIVPLGYRIQASDDPQAMSGGGTWRDVYVSAKGKGVALVGEAGVLATVVMPASTNLSRYLRVKIDAYATGQTTAAIADVYAVPVPPITGTVTDRNGNPVAGAAVGGFLDDGPYVRTDANGRYTLAAPLGTAVVGAHIDGNTVSGPRWLDNNASPLNADFMVFSSGPDILAGKTPAFSPSSVSGNNASLTDMALDTLWTSGRSAVITSASPSRITFTLNSATVNEVDIHWKNYPAAWHLEMTNTITNASGRNPYASTRTYYTQGEASGSANENGGYVATGTTDRRVTAIKLAPVYGVTSMAIVVTKTLNATPVSIYEANAFSPQPTIVDVAATALRISAGLQAAPADPNAFYRWNAVNTDNKINMRDAFQLLADLSTEVKPLRVLVINYQPFIEQAYTVNSTTYAGVPLRTIPGWNDPYPNTAGHVSDMQLSSHGFARLYLLPQIEVDEYPVFLPTAAYPNGFRFTDMSYLDAWKTNTWPDGHCDENAIIKEFDLIRRVDCGDVDEVFVQATPGMAMWETTMAGPNAYWCNSSPPSGTNGTRLFVMTFFNYERGTDVMIHDWGHRLESILGNKVYGGYWYGKTTVTSTYDQFARYDQVFPGQGSVGNCHYPVNGTSGYDYSNPTFVSSDADDWFNYPNYPSAGAPRWQVNRETWAAPRVGGDGTPDYHRNYLIWMFAHMPHVPGYGSDGKLANWWKYLVDLNAYPESR